MLIASPRVRLCLRPPPELDEPVVSARARRVISPRSLRLLKLTESPALAPAAIAVDGERERRTGRRSNLSSSNCERGAIGMGALSDGAAVESVPVMGSLVFWCRR